MGDAMARWNPWKLSLLWIEGKSEEFVRVLGEFVALLVIAMVVGGVNFAAYMTFNKGPSEVELSDRIRTLTASLTTAATTISQIEEEVKRRHALVEKLQQDAETAQKISALNRQQVDAVAQVLKGEIEKEQRAGFWMNQLQNGFYALMGVILAELYHFLTRWYRRRMLMRQVGRS
jgi:hypothetical protein